MFTQRATAYKLAISDLLKNQYVQAQAEGEVDYVEVGSLHVARTRILATVVKKMIFDNKKTGFIIIDDGTESIRARVFENNLHLISELAIGDLIDLVGRVKKYNEEVYLIPEIVQKASPDLFVLRKIETGKKIEAEPKKEEKTEEKAAEAPKEKGFTKESMYELIKKMDKGTGADFKEIMSESKLEKTECLTLIRELMADGTCFEPRAGKYKILE